MYASCRGELDGERPVAWLAAPEARYGFAHPRVPWECRSAAEPLGFSLQQIGSRALLSANRAAELGHHKAVLERLGKRAPGSQAPSSGELPILALDPLYVSGDFNGD